MPMGYFSKFRRPKSNYFMGTRKADCTSRADESLRTTGGRRSIYESSDYVAPLCSEIVAYPEVDPKVAQAVTRVQTVPETMYVTRTPEALVAQPITYERMRQEVSPFNWQAGREPTVRLAYTPAPMWLNRFVPSETMPHTIPNMQRIADDGGMMLPRPSERFSAPAGSRMGGEEMQEAYWQAYLAAFGAQRTGQIPVRAPSNHDLSTPVTTQQTIPQMQFKSPVPEQTTSMEQLVRSGCQKETGSMVGPEMFSESGLEDFAPTQEAGPVSKFPTWAWLAIAAGIYLVFKRG